MVQLIFQLLYKYFKIVLVFILLGCTINTSYIQTSKENMENQNITFYAKQMAEYDAKCRKFWVRDFILIAAIGAGLICGLTYVISMVTGLSPLLGIEGRLLALLMWIGIMILPVKMLHPVEPEKPYDSLNGSISDQ